MLFIIHCADEFCCVSRWHTVVGEIDFGSYPLLLSPELLVEFAAFVRFQKTLKRCGENECGAVFPVCNSSKVFEGIHFFKLCH